MTSTTDLSQETKIPLGELEQIDLSIEGMTCSSCVATVERALNTLPGAIATVNFATETAHILAPRGLKRELLIAAVKKSGYKASLHRDETESFSRSRALGWRVLITAFFAIPAIMISMVHAIQKPIDSWLMSQLDTLGILHPAHSLSGWLVIGLTTPIIIFIAWPIHRAALRNLAHPTMDTLISLGSLIAFTWSIYANATGRSDQLYSEVSAGLIFFIILGRYFEMRAKRRAGSALAQLLSLGSKVVTILRGSEEIIAPIEDLRIGDNCVVKPGESIPTDGVVISGESSINNSLITGESLPIEVRAGSKVIGGAINLQGRLVMMAERVGRDTELSRITSMVLTAQTEKAPIQKLADRISAIFVPTVLVLAIATFSAWYVSGRTLAFSISAAVALLIIACPCALGLATPVALLVATGRGAEKGIVLRKTQSLEVAKKIDTVIFDKTGTLTSGVMQVINIVTPATHPFAMSDLLSAIHTIENENNHPIAVAITKFMAAQNIPRAEFSDYSDTNASQDGQYRGVAARVKIHGEFLPVLIGSPSSILQAVVSMPPELTAGIEAAIERGNSVAAVAIDGLAAAIIEIGDSIKGDAMQVIATFKKMGITPWLVTGDSAAAALDIAEKCGIDPDYVIGNASPHDKIDIVKKFKANGSIVLMVGDGVNDAAAMAEADLSMAIGTGTDTAISVADITLMRPSLFAAVDSLKLANRTMRTIRMNLGWAFIYNIIGIPIAALGALKPMYAGGAMAASSLLVVLNSLRIRRF